MGHIRFKRMTMSAETFTPMSKAKRNVHAGEIAKSTKIPPCGACEPVVVPMEIAPADAPPIINDGITLIDHLR